MVAAVQAGYGAAAPVARPARIGASTTGRPEKATAESASMKTTRSRSEVTITRRRSKRSASTPPSGPKTTIGATRAAVVTASQVALCVRS